MKLNANGIEIEYAAYGNPEHEPMLLIMGLGLQMISWPGLFIDMLLKANYRVIVMDNRDCGLSSELRDAPTPNLLWMGLKDKLGLSTQVPYTLSDMALDGVAVLDALGIQRAHVLGLSMGGMIAQRMAIHHPKRVHSLISVMSSSGAKDLPKPDPTLLHRLYTPLKGSQGFESWVNKAMESLQLIASPAFQDELSEVKARVELALQRSYRPMGVLRQTAAVLADSDRADLLHLIKAPTMVVHGRLDPLVPIACGRDTHQRILGSVWLEIPEMAHDLSTKLTPLLMPHLLTFLRAHPLQSFAS
jgi:hypothetical protein